MELRHVVVSAEVRVGIQSPSLTLTADLIDLPQNPVVHGTAPKAICALCAHYRPRSDRGHAKSLRVGSSTVSDESYRPRCLAKLEASSTIVSIMSAADLSVEAALAEEAMCADRTASERFEHALLLHHPP